MSGFRITEITAFTCIEDDDEEGVCAFYAPHLRAWMPMVAADMVRMEFLRDKAREITLMTGKPVFERRFVPSGEYTVVEP